MSENKLADPGEIKRSKILGVPLLTDDQREALHTQADKGIQPVEGLRRFPTFEDWIRPGNTTLAVGGVRGRNNFWVRFDDGMQGRYTRETQWSQRYSELFPEQDAELIGFAKTYFVNPEDHSKPIPETIERAYWTAYEQLAN